MKYYEAKSFLGTWSPQTQRSLTVTAKDGKTYEQKTTGLGKEIRNIHDVPKELQHLSLNDLMQHFNKKD